MPDPNFLNREILKKKKELEELIAKYDLEMEKDGKAFVVANMTIRHDGNNVLFFKPGIDATFNDIMPFCDKRALPRLIKFLTTVAIKEGLISA